MTVHEAAPVHTGRGGDPIQLIAPNGERRSDSELDHWVDDVDDAMLTRLHRDMVAARRIDTEATALQRQGELALWPPLLGQEASQIGSVHALRGDDFVFPSYRETGVMYVRGIDTVDILRVWRGNANGGWDPHEFSVGTAQIVIGSQALHAAGYAMGITMDGGDQAAITYFGDGATSQGDVSEAMVFAASYQAPCVFFCQNNGWAISEPVTVQSRTPLADRAPGFGIPSMRIDGNDVLAVLGATRWALERARTGSGPSFIEAVTYRMGAHTTADDPTRYRTEADLEAWRAKDPIARVEALLAGRGADVASVRAGAQAEADRVAAHLRLGIAQMPDPEPLSVFDHAYAEAHPWLERQREEYRLYLDQFEGTGEQR